jgi:hypothetical protein
MCVGAAVVFVLAVVFSGIQRWRENEERAIRFAEARDEAFGLIQELGDVSLLTFDRSPLDPKTGPPILPLLGYNRFRDGE